MSKRIVVTLSGEVDLSETIWFDADVSEMPEDEMNSLMIEAAQDDISSFIEDIKLFENIRFHARPSNQ